MDSWVMVCQGCGVRIRTSKPVVTRAKTCPRCRSSLESSTIKLLVKPQHVNISAVQPLDDPPSADETAASASSPISKSGLLRWTIASIALTSFILLLFEYRATTGRPGSTPAATGAPSATAVKVVPAKSSTSPTVPPCCLVSPSAIRRRALLAPVPPKTTLRDPETAVASHEGPVTATEESVTDRSRPANPPPPPRPEAVVPIRHEAVPPPPSPEHEPTATGTPDRPKPASRVLVHHGSAQETTPKPTPMLERSIRSRTGPQRVRIGDGSGRTMIARVYGGPESRVVLLPDGQLGWPNQMVYTDEPFQPLSADAMRESLLAGPYRGFQCKPTQHYLIFYQSSTRFADNSARLLESLYDGLRDQFQSNGITVHDAEFPLVAVIFGTETDFRRHKEIAPDIQAYYEIVSNRIFFYETKDRELDAPEVTAMRKPQTVAHEGTHQILQNIGVQPRLAEWPLWLVEGMAELASATETKRGARWVGCGKVNPFHMATIQDLEDSLALQGQANRMSRARIGRNQNTSLVEYIVTRKEFTPTDYALAWALTHYLNKRRPAEFVAFLKEMSQLVPFQKHTPDEHLEMFRRAFGGNLAGMDLQIRRHLNSLSREFEPLVYYAVTFEQPLMNGLIRRGTLVSQSPLVIQEWLEQLPSPNGGPYVWHAWPFRTRGKAFQFTDQWMSVR